MAYIHLYLKLTVTERMVPAFTEKGFDVIDTPAHIQEKLLKAVNKGLENFETLPIEHDVDAIYHPPGVLIVFITRVPIKAYSTHFP